MSLAPGVRLGAYEVVALLGAGGMGEVYRARDARLNRDVAIKILPEHFAADTDRVARFQREAQVLASLNHPNIAHIHGLEEAGTTKALVLELVDGPTLADLIANGPIPLDEALPIAKQIAEALETAHEHGIIHRDLKPANIKLTSDGTVKVLDFGLAKASQASDSGLPASGLSLSPTITSPALATHAGIILGTAAYMSPEQAKGKPVDRRTDIWAFGCVLFEMLTGKRAFGRDDVTETVAEIIKGTPDWHALPTGTPASLSKLIGRCLEKSRRNRIADASDVRYELEHFSDVADHVAAIPQPTSHSRSRLWFLVGAALLITVVAVAVGMLESGSRTDDARAYRSSIVLPEGVVLGSGLITPAQYLALSPDGRRIAFVAGSNNERSLWVRLLSEHSAQPIPGTAGATAPFWSPDSRYIAYHSGGRLRRVEASGGSPTTICDAPGDGGNAAGGAWSSDGTILFARTTTRGLYRVAVTSGKPEPVTTLDGEKRESWHGWPVFLPDGHHFLYFAWGAGPDARSGIYLSALGSQERQLLVERGSNPGYADGHLFFLRDQMLMAQAFDSARRELRGEPFAIAEEIALGGGSARTGAFSVADGGVLAYLAGGSQSQTQLTWFDRDGKQLSTLGESGDYSDLELSPDEKQLAVSTTDRTIGTRDIWIFDVARGVPVRATSDPADDLAYVWSPDGRQAVFNSRRKGSIDLYQLSAGMYGSEKPLLENELGKWPLSFTPDGKTLLYLVTGSTSSTLSNDLWVLSLSDPAKVFPFVTTPFNETPGQFSPSGQWVAYTSNESGRPEVYVAPFPGPGQKKRVSAEGGQAPRWRGDGRELFFLTNEGMVATEITMRGSELDVGAVKRLFNVRALGRGPYDVTADGRRFIVNARPDATTLTEPVTLLVNWQSAVLR